MDLDERRDAVEKWACETLRAKAEFVAKGYKTWEFGLFVLTVIVGLILIAFFLPGLFAAEETTPNSRPYETIITFEEDPQNTTYVSINCQSDDFITSGQIAYSCSFRFEQYDSSLQTYSEEYMRDARGKDLFIKDWARRTDPDTEVRQGAIRVLTDEFVHQAGEGVYTIHGDFVVVAPRNPGIYSFSISMGDFFGGKTGSSQQVTVFSPSEASTLQTREMLIPFQQLIVVGILLSLLKFWIDLFYRINRKIKS